MFCCPDEKRLSIKCILHSHFADRAPYHVEEISKFLCLKSLGSADMVFRSQKTEKHFITWKTESTMIVWFYTSQDGVSVRQKCAVLMLATLKMVRVGGECKKHPFKCISSIMCTAEPSVRGNNNWENLLERNVSFLYFENLWIDTYVIELR